MSPCRRFRPPRVHMLRALLVMLVNVGHATELLGYLENWNNVKWWDNDLPGNCVQGCFLPKPFFELTAPYSALNYGFVFFTTSPAPDQVNCTATTCPVWDGKAIYLSKAAMQGSHVVDGTTDIETVSPGIVSIAEAVRLGRMHPSGPKRTKITLGGWSDFARLGNEANARAAAFFMAKLVQFTFADGVDIDMEHLTPFSTFSDDDEFGALVAFIDALRKGLDAVASSWVSSARLRQAALEKQFAAYQPWQKSEVAPYFNTSIAYLGEVAANGAPHLEISFTTRFNAFVPPDDPFNYLMPKCTKPNSTFATDNEGTKLWPHIGSNIDTVNIMAYDAEGLAFDYEVMLENFVKGGVPAEKVRTTVRLHRAVSFLGVRARLHSPQINMGFEPGEQAAGGVWEGKAVDEATARLVKEGGYGGCMLWAVNPSATTQPKGAKDCPETASALASILSPSSRWGPTPKYTVADAQTGWLPNVAIAHVTADMVETQEAWPTRPSLQRPRS